MVFRDLVYKYAAEIPKGKVVTYGQLAKLAGKPRAARAVGFYMRTNPYYPTVPCHRVVGFNGNLIGYTGKGGINGKKKMLVREGVYFIKNRVDLAKSQWRLK